MRRALRSVALRLIRLGLLVFPKRRHVVVFGWPASEPNVTEITRALLRHYDGDVFWLDAKAGALKDEPGADERLRIVRKNSPHGLLRFLTAQATFMSDGLFGSPRPVSTAPFVNLWHGDGPKSTLGNFVPSTYLVTSSRRLAEDRRVRFGVPAGNLIAVGTPRLNQMRRPLTSGEIELLGIDPERPFILWMPTYRRVSGSVPTAAWVDVAGPDRDAEMNARVAQSVARLIELGIQLVVKVHPLDGRRVIDGARVLTTSDLEERDVDLYRLLAGSSGLVTDYSSVWTDYLVLDRPIGFYVPDLDDYRSGRGLVPPDIIDRLPGRTLSDETAFEEFLAEVLGQRGDGGARARTREFIRFEVADDPAKALLDRLEFDGVLRLRAADVDCPGHFEGTEANTPRAG